LRERLKKRGLKLMLDFVPNHMGLGHPGPRNTRSISSAGPRRTWPAPRRTTPGSSAGAATRSSPTGATLISRAGPTPCSSTTRTRQPRRRWSRPS
jgi:glycosidase